MLVPFVFAAWEQRARKSHWVRVAARLKPEVTIEQAGADAAAVGAALEREYPDLDIEGELEQKEAQIDPYPIFRMLLLPLEEVMQARQYHPEGDALYHTLQVFELAKEHRPYDEEFLLAALLHDVGKGLDRSNHVEAGLHDAELDSGQHRPLIVEAAHQHADAAVFGAHDVLGRDEAIVEHQLGGWRTTHPDLVDLLPDRKTFHALFDDEGGDASASVLG